MALPHLQSGELIEILPQWKPSSTAISVLYPQSRQLSPKVRAFTDWVAELFAGCPLLSGRDETDTAIGSCGVYQRQLGMPSAMTLGQPQPQPGMEPALLQTAPPRRRSAREEAAEYAL